MGDTNELLEALDVLTLPRTDHLIQSDDDGKWLKTHKAEHPPLLAQLEAAITPSSNTAAGSASLASTRNLIDSDAAFEHGKISGAIGDWCRIYKVPTTRNPIVDLRQWYIAFTRNPSDSGWHERELKRWATVIRNIIEPLGRFVIEVPCPVCLSETWTNPEGESIKWPILVTYKRTQDERTANHVARCRAVKMVDGLEVPCGAEWDSWEAIEELGQEIREATRPLDNAMTTT